jgi:uncharacterized repeat protein (TIGR01451 family)
VGRVRANRDEEESCMHLLKKLGAGVALCVTFVGITALPAIAHHPIVSGKLVCNVQTGNYDVTWTVSNGNWENRVMTLDQSNRAAVPLSSYAPNESKVYTESLPGNTNGSTTLTVRGDWNNGGPQNVVGSATVRSSGTCQPELHPAITVTKSCPQAAPVGEQIIYRIRVTNSGDETLEGITVQDSILGNLSGSFADTLDAGEYEERTFTHTVGTSPDPLVNTVTAAGSGVTSDKVVSSEASCRTDVLRPDITVTKSCPQAALAGEQIIYRIRVTNSGDETLEGITVQDSILGNLSGSFADTLDAGEYDERTFTHTVGTSPDPLVNTVYVSGSGVSSKKHVMAEASCRTDVLRPAIDIVKRADDRSVDAGEEIGYTVTVSNTGDGTAEDVELTDELPDDDGLHWEIESTSGGWDCEIDAGTLTCGGDDFDLRPGESASVHITSPTTPDTCGKVKNQAEAEWSEDSDSDDVESEVVRIEVECHPELDIVKEADDRSVDAGEEIGYTVTVSNDGDGTAEDVELTDALPDDEGLDWEVAGTTGGWDCEIDAGTLTCGGEGFDLEPGEEASVHITSPTTPDTCGTVRNQAEADASNAEDDEGEDGEQGDGEGDVPGDDEDDVESEVVRIEVECTPAIQVVKDGPDLVHRGDTITYLFDVTNVGQLDLYDVELTDPKCDEGTLELVADGDGDQVLAIGEVWGYTCMHLVTDEDPDPLPNTATVRGDAEEGEDEEEVTDTDDHVVDIIHPAIEIEKTVSERLVEIGDTVVYTYVVTNTGDTTLYDVGVDDDILGHIGDVPVLEPGEAVTLTKDFVVGAQPVTNVAIASGEDVLGHSVSADDAVTVTPIAGATPPTTPFTGSDAGRLGLVTLALFGIGVTVVASTRRGRSKREAA